MKGGSNQQAVVGVVLAFRTIPYPEELAGCNGGLPKGPIAIPVMRWCLCPKGSAIWRVERNLRKCYDTLS